MDRTWMRIADTTSDEYINGIESFLEFAYRNSPPGDTRIYCPCIDCRNRYLFDRQIVKTHCICRGFNKEYTNWTRHGESYVYAYNVEVNQEMPDSSDDLSSDYGGMQMIWEATGMATNVDGDQPRTIEEVVGSDESTLKFFKLLKDAESPLYTGCEEFTSLQFIVELMHLKVTSKWTNKSFTSLLNILKRALPKDAKLPKSHREANKMASDMGFRYETFDVCPNHCMIYRNGSSNLTQCDICSASRYVDEDNKKAAKKVRYFPLKSRLQRLFWSSKTASLMRWHAEERVDDGIMRHPVDSLAWKKIDQQYPTFASDSRNVRLALATDGFNPFGMDHVHSTWPVVLMTYNLPSNLCMKPSFFMLSILIEGPKGPGDKLDVYLQLLIEELKDLWENGLPTYDSSKNEMFTLYAMLLWTISDFPAYAMLSGWSTKGEFACPRCNRKTQSMWLVNGCKWCYTGHRRFLKPNHKFRKEKKAFIGKFDMRGRPKVLLGSEVLQRVKNLETVYKKEDVIKKKMREIEDRRNDMPKIDNWKKRSIFYELTYWEHNLVPHNLDVMHIEKKFCDNVLFTLLDTPGKTKDHLKARRDLVALNIRNELHPQLRANGKEFLPPAIYSMTKVEKDIFLKVLKNVKVPDGYSSNILRCVHLEERNIWGLKSHDCHALLQQLIPITGRRYLSLDVVKPLIELSIFFSQLCRKNLKVSELDGISDQIAVTLCHLEKIFPPSFFDIMEHLPIHLAEEARLAGVVRFRWMYPIERYLSTLKGHVRNRAYPEASMATGVIADECMRFCGRYLDDMNPLISNDDGGDESGHASGKSHSFNLDETTWMQTHRYVLNNIASVKPYICEHLEWLRQEMPQANTYEIQRIHNESFITWFRDYVLDSNHKVSEEIQALGIGPRSAASRYKTYIIKGVKFRVKALDKHRKTQNCGVSLKASITSYASHRDRNPTTGDVNFYGRLIDIIEISYTTKMRFVLLKCEWVANSGKKLDGITRRTMVNFKHLMYKENRSIDEPFILASQASQVWYSQDPVTPSWYVVIEIDHGEHFEMYSSGAKDNIIRVPQIVPFSSQHLADSFPDDEVHWIREDVQGREAEANALNKDEVEISDDDID